MVSLFPPLAEGWKAEVQATRGLARFGPEEYRKLKDRYPVTWIVVARPDAEWADVPVCEWGRGGL